MNTVEDVVKDLTRVLGKLSGTEDRMIARRNARKRVLAAIRNLRAVVDRDFPALLPSRVGVKRLTFEGRCDRLFRKGWQTTTRPGDYALHGVPTRRIDGTDRRNRSAKLDFIPGWAKALGTSDPGKLRAAKKDVLLQRSIVAAAALAKD